VVTQRPPTLSIITVTMNHMGVVNTLLESIYGPTSPNVNFETILVDNCSSDCTLEYVHEHYPHIRVLLNQKVQGYARNANCGIHASKGDFILLINPDVQVLPGSVETLVHFMQSHPKVAIAGPLLLNPDLTVQYSCRRFITLYTLLLRTLEWGSDRTSKRAVREYLMTDVDLSKDQPVDWLLGAAMLVRRQAFEQVGLLDERFFLYVEDEDWCFRMWKAGWEVYYVPQARMIHAHQRASVRGRVSQKTFHHAKSLLYFLWKHRISRFVTLGRSIGPSKT